MTSGDIDPSALDQLVADLLRGQALGDPISSRAELVVDLAERVTELAESAFGQRDETALGAAHRTLFHIYEQHFLLPDKAAVQNQFHPVVAIVQHELERRWEDFEVARCDLGEASVPTRPPVYLDYFQKVFENHYATHHEVFDYLAEKASREQILRYFSWDAPLNLRFYDILVMSMIGAAGAARQELIENLLDETGRGDDRQAHTSLFQETLSIAGLDRSPVDAASTLPWQGLSGYNLSLNLALHRKHHFRLIGNMSITEQIDPPNYEKLLRGCERVGLADASKLAYYSMHIEQEVAHGQGWTDHVLLPALVRDGDAGRQMLIGALMRLNTMGDYYDALLASFESAA